jgi:hypothetical protein
MDRDGFMRCLVGTEKMGQRRCIEWIYNWNQWNQLESMVRKESSERHNKTGKEKSSAEAISSEGHC